MALNLNNNSLKDLVNAANDAHSNLYEIDIYGGQLTDVSQKLAIRTDGFTPPDVSQESYTVHYVTAYIDWPTPKVNVTRNFPLSFRVDSNWTTYKKLLDQQKVTMNPSHDFVATNVVDLRSQGKLFNVSVYALEKGMTSENIEVSNKKKIFEFHDCWITNMKPSDFSRETAEPIKTTCTVNFLEMYDIESGFPDNSDVSPMDQHGESQDKFRP